jgi:hypothetical protein
MKFWERDGEPIRLLCIHAADEADVLARAALPRWAAIRNPSHEPTFGRNQSLPRRGVAGGVCIVAISPFAGESAGPPLRWGVPSTGDQLLPIVLAQTTFEL